MGYRILFEPFGLLLLGLVNRGVALEMASLPVCLALDKRGALTLSRPCYGLRSGLVYGHYIVAVNRYARHTVGGGAVRATAYGSKVIKSIEIDPACVDPDDVEMLQDLVLSAVNEAMRMAEEATNSEVSKLTGGMGLGF